MVRRISLRFTCGHDAKFCNHCAILYCAEIVRFFWCCCCFFLGWVSLPSINWSETLKWHSEAYCLFILPAWCCCFFATVITYRFMTVVQKCQLRAVFLFIFYFFVANWRPLSFISIACFIHFFFGVANTVIDKFFQW